MNVAIFGAGGSIGPVAATELLRRGHTVRAVGRSEARLQALGASVEPFVADLADAEQARAAAAGMDAILYCVGVPYPEFELHPKLTRIALDAARAAGVTEFLLISTVYPYGRPRTATVTEDHPREPHTRKGKWRKEQQDLVLAAHDPNGLRTVVLVLPDFYGPGAGLSFVSAAFDATVLGVTANLIGPLSTPHEFVYVPDVAPVVADLLERPDVFGTIYNFAGPGPITTQAFVDEIFRAGTPQRVVVATKPMLQVLGWFNPLMREIVEMTYLWTTPVLLDDAKLQRVLGPLKKTPYIEGIRATLAAHERASKH